MMRLLPSLGLAALTLVACSIPDLPSLGEKKCDLDAGHPCIAGYACVQGVCRLPSGGACQEGATRTCGSDAGTCRPGQQKCSDGAWSSCSGAVGPGVEVCDGKDNDCNGAVDDELTDLPACALAQGVCAGAHPVCADGGYPSSCGAREYGALYEVTEVSCDGKDNDCDGTVDDGVTGGACPSQGVCVGASLACTGGQPGACLATGFEAVEATCDGKDNDCDGQVDEGVVAASPCEKQAGVCAGKKPACVGGAFEAHCSAATYGPDYEPVEVTCDGKDNDCDGVTDDNVTGGACPQVGVCRGASLACTGGVSGACQSPGYEAVEATCDGKDNDCDGQVDEGIPAVTACEKQVGVCAGKAAACVDGGFEARCTGLSYGPGYEGLEATCDGKDNDCDGQVDRAADGGFLRQGLCELSQGVCAGASRACVGGNHEAPCTLASYGPLFQTAEFTCDGLDNDCDGRADLSREVSLLATPNALSNHLGLAAGPQGGVLAVYVDQRAGVGRVFLQAYGADLKPAGNEVELSDAAVQEARVPVITRAGAGWAVTWAEKLNGGTERIVLARLGPDGAVAWRQTVQSPVVFYKEPRVAASQTQDRIVVGWIESPALVARAAVYDGSGTLVTPAVDLTSRGAGETVFDLDLVGRPGQADVVVAWVAFQGSEHRVRFRAYSPTLTTTSALREVMYTGETARNLRLAPWGTSGELAGAWISSVGSTTATIRYVANALQTASAPQAASTFSGQAFDLSLAPTRSTAFAAWVQGTGPGVLGFQPLGQDAGTTTLAPLNATSVFAPALADRPDGGALAVGFEVDRGQGLDFAGFEICLP